MPGDELDAELAQSKLPQFLLTAQSVAIAYNNRFANSLLGMASLGKAASSQSDPRLSCGTYGFEGLDTNPANAPWAVC